MSAKMRKMKINTGSAEKVQTSTVKREERKPVKI